MLQETNRGMDAAPETFGSQFDDRGHNIMTMRMIGQNKTGEVVEQPDSVDRHQRANATCKTTVFYLTGFTEDLKWIK